jgi:hypothetical protein
VVQIVCSERDLDDVVDNHAWVSGAAGLQGRVDAHLRLPLSRRGCVSYGSGSLALIHSRDPELLHAIQSGRISHPDGGGLVDGHHLQPFGQASARTQSSAPAPATLRERVP